MARGPSFLHQTRPCGAADNTSFWRGPKPQVPITHGIRYVAAGKVVKEVYVENEVCYKSARLSCSGNDGGSLACVVKFVFKH